MRSRIVAALAIVVLAATANAQTTSEREAFLVANGEGYAHMAPDFAEFSAEVTSRADSLEAATREHTERNAKASAFLRGLEKQGVRMGRSSFRLEQARPKNPPAAPKKGRAIEYHAITTYALKATKLDSVNEAINAVAAANMFEVKSIRYGINDEGRAIDDARRAAVKDARHQAEVVAAEAGVQLGDILEITDGTAQSLGNEAAVRLSVPNVRRAAPATISYRAAISVKWRIKPKT